MAYLVLFIILGIFLGVGGWQLIVLISENRDKDRKYQAASSYALERNKPLLVAGGPFGITRRRRFFGFGMAHGYGDVCLDINPRAFEGSPCGVVADVRHIPFADKSFGAAFASHLLEHLPTTDDAKQALDELHRVAEAVFVVYPYRQSIAGWIIPDHHLWIWQKGDITYLKQKGRSGIKEEYCCQTSGQR